MDEGGICAKRVKLSIRQQIITTIILVIDFPIQVI